MAKDQDHSATRVVVTPARETLTGIPEAECRNELEALEDRADAEAVREFKARLASGEEEMIPAEFANRLIDGENKIKVWREFRGMSVGDLAKRAGIGTGHLSQIEKGERDGSFEAIKKIAAALNISVDDLA
ncbi:transcriptional regulator [Rhizobium leguminosarum bv. trifolii]|uniref:helix-turn-helix transcriptional regulator n=1 Tax=Rhizobium leguminosarum TaxID=384 RepID=UPI000E2FE253|nr:helix-turn-helix transcriptional regulator [Rhizobium leguminosarum]RFB95564.1 transcriptional regulator [Rhizobium leguminosarum bv. trifolii]